jgi:SecD/SecF fusion protein
MKFNAYIILAMVLLTLAGAGQLAVRAQNSTLFYETIASGDILHVVEDDDLIHKLLLQGESAPKSSLLGSCREADCDQLLARLQSETIRLKFPDRIQWMWGRSHDGLTPLYALCIPDQGNSPGTGDIQDIDLQEGNKAGTFDLFITFNEAGSERWARMTRENIGQDIAIVVNQRVISAPRVRDEIKFGKCRISGDLNLEEAQAIKKALEQ